MVSFQVLGNGMNELSMFSCHFMFDARIPLPMYRLQTRGGYYCKTHTLALLVMYQNVVHLLLILVNETSLQEQVLVIP